MRIQGCSWSRLGGVNQGFWFHLGSSGRNASINCQSFRFLDALDEKQNKNKSSSFHFQPRFPLALLSVALTPDQ